MTDDLRARVLADPTVPEAVRAALERGFTLEDIRLDPLGRWWHAGAPIEHERMRETFSRSVDRTEGGTYVLRIGRFTYPVTVEGTPLFVERVRLDEEGGALELTLQGGEEARVEADAPLLLAGDGELLVDLVAPGGREGTLRARFLRPAYHALLDRAVEVDGAYVIPVGARRFRLTAPSGSAPAPAP